MVEGAGGGSGRREVGDGGTNSDPLEHGSIRGFSSSTGEGLEQSNRTTCNHCGCCSGCCCSAVNSDTCGTSGSPISHGEGYASGCFAHTQTSGNVMMRNTKSDNIIAALRNRETGVRSSCLRWPISEALPSATFNLQQAMDMYQNEEALWSFNDILSQRSAITDICAIQDVVVVRANSGLTAAFSRASKRILTYLNQASSSRVESIFYNKYTDSIVVVSTETSDSHTRQRCCSLPIQSIRRRKLNYGPSIFEDENISWPGFIDFDSTNGIVIVKTKRLYKIFDMKTYAWMYEFLTTKVEEVVCRPHILLVIYEKTSAKLPLEIKSVENGRRMACISCPLGLKETKVLDMVDEKLILKRDNIVELLNVRSLKSTQIQIDEFRSQRLHGRNIFITFQRTSSEMRDLDGQIIRKLQNHVLSDIKTVENKVIVTSEQDAVISACKNEGTQYESVNMNCVESGRLMSVMHPKVKITSICYNDELKEIYIGTSRGKVQVWSV